MLAKHLNKSLFSKEVAMEPTRDGYGRGLVKLGQTNPNVVALCADLTESTRTQPFAQKFPDRFVEMGVAEQNLAAVSSGMAAMGKLPFISSYATFSPGRNWEQIRTTICINQQKVVIAGAHAGISVGPDGATHQALEDIALMRSLPTMTVINPCDSLEAEKATLAAAEYPGPIYLRFHREKTATITSKNSPFEIGKAQVLREGSDVSVIACGPVLYEALIAAEDLSKVGLEVQVINLSTIKPIDLESIIKAAQKTKAIVTVEEHQITGGLGSAVSEVLVEHFPVPMQRVGVADRFGESGTPEELLEKFGLKAKHIKVAIKEVLKRKTLLYASET
ncbi:MAG: transketolase [Candidatus Woykebacteria bacterium RIFCSPHIGHO2_12_FULL_43_10]|uniref:Transketolase n=2 Tax=Candidatus Woykeibacteriota TaxID=1817899 RepID=A0A1G1WX10_9BACT|nr:MAG: transketolase [Candidatus Woykebacteria bacterium RIFCSPHIGHO2_01_FULL_43_29]OGY28610.1 MAG: transketolase [Candidatus Woykebacteria bacterium RIFCSPHIGHO2_02_FULL_43_16b]OGY28762.1 MAG: transketolase [Candidatus Woykebacteria bacterium RIFCSPHIGHO2_12_FULL_43_10]OGY32292.1 MAG: transketolase [Candidatus Woykebacteria bacterium RIFCSPLOWO2_01_FULL_43_14]